ncbi:hypothetical protein D9756_002554 [Leucocoprinus leucothites]|uniref:Uncharacterized protein n=1 Tax=Leucocoprinus leucothites TaxID=201217 RepID=A0A8H5LME5_9AGAR|nr:hypothetical protein D9756_002554 [Leucoagaricus leucothites]
MDMDTDWCLTCNKRVEGSNYCSLQCRNGAGPSNYHRRLYPSYIQDEIAACEDYLPEEGEGCEEEFLEDDYDYDEDDQMCNIEAVSKTNWAGRGYAGIRAWAAEIPLGAHPEAQDLVSPPPDDISSDTSASSTTSSTYRAPNLVRPSRPLPPSLTMTKPEFSATTPPRPILNLQKHLAALTHSPGSTARTSVASEDSLPTPASTHAMPFSTLPGRPFPFISDARACDLAACTQLNSPSFPSRSSPSPKNKNNHLVQSRGVPIAPRILSSPPSSLDNFDLSPPLWVTNSMAPQATKPRSIVRKDSNALEASRGRPFYRVAA